MVLDVGVEDFFVDEEEVFVVIIILEDFGIVREVLEV